MTKATIPTNSDHVTRFFDSLEARLGIPEHIILDGSRAFLSTEFDRSMRELCESAYTQAPAPTPASQKLLRAGD